MVAIVFIGVLVFLSGSSSQSDSDTCTYLNNTYHIDDYWVDDITCHTCYCSHNGAYCTSDRQGHQCIFNSSIAHPGDPVCAYAYHRYLVGDRFTALDGCNTCLCTAIGMQCTVKACDPNGFAEPSVEPLYGDCVYNDGWYRFNTQWLAEDGCNTCFCYGVGDYTGPHACTTSKCQNHTVSVNA